MQMRVTTPPGAAPTDTLRCGSGPPHHRTPSRTVKPAEADTTCRSVGGVRRRGPSSRTATGWTWPASGSTRSRKGLVAPPLGADASGGEPSAADQARRLANEALGLPPDGEGAPARCADRVRERRRPRGVLERRGGVGALPRPGDPSEGKSRAPAVRRLVAPRAGDAGGRSATRTTAAQPAHGSASSHEAIEL